MGHFTETGTSIVAPAQAFTALSLVQLGCLRCSSKKSKLFRECNVVILKTDLRMAKMGIMMVSNIEVL